MDLQPFPPAQTHAASCSICSVDFKMYTNVGQVLVRFHQSFVQLNAGVPRCRGGDHHAPDGGDRLILVRKTPKSRIVVCEHVPDDEKRFCRYLYRICLGAQSDAGQARHRHAMGALQPFLWFQRTGSFLYEIGDLSGVTQHGQMPRLQG